MNRRLSLTLIALSITLALGTVSADSGMQNALLDNFNSTSNVTAPGARIGPNGSYIGTGSVSMRGQVSNVTIANVDGGSFTSGGITGGCGGIDVTGPSMSFMGSDQLVSTAKNVVSNAGYLLLQMAIKNVSAQMGETMQEGMDKLDALNLGQLNSCKIAESMVNSMGSAMNNTAGADAAESGEASDAHEGANPGDGESAATAFPSDIIRDNYVWAALKDQDVAGWLGSTASTDKKTREQFMSLVGTVVSCDDPEKPCGLNKARGGEAHKDPEIQYVPPTVRLEEIVAPKRIGAAKVQVLSCKDDKCIAMDVVDTGEWKSITDNIVDVMFGKDGSVGYLAKLRLNDANASKLTKQELNLFAIHPEYMSMVSALAKQGRHDDASAFARKYALMVATQYAFDFMQSALSSTRLAVARKNNLISNAMLPKIDDRIKELKSEYDALITKVGGPSSMQTYFASLATSGGNYAGADQPLRMTN